MPMLKVEHLWKQFSAKFLGDVLLVFYGPSCGWVAHCSYQDSVVIFFVGSGPYLRDGLTGSNPLQILGISNF